MSEQAERVEHGAEWLDTIVPGWETWIDLSELELSCTKQCVLGQVFYVAAEVNDIKDGYSYVDRSLERGNFAELEWMNAHGFDGPEDSLWDGLQNDWVECIKARFDAGIEIASEGQVSSSPRLAAGGEGLLPLDAFTSGNSDGKESE